MTDLSVGSGILASVILIVFIGGGTGEGSISIKSLKADGF